LPFTAIQARRNLVTQGVDLNALAGREFHIGDVRIRGIRLCEPCNYLAKETFPETLRGLVRKGGLRAQILTAGTIRVGDNIVPLLASGVAIIGVGGSRALLEKTFSVNHA